MILVSQYLINHAPFIILDIGNYFPTCVFRWLCFVHASGTRSSQTYIQYIFLGCYWIQKGCCCYNTMLVNKLTITVHECCFLDYFYQMSTSSQDIILWRLSCATCSKCTTQTLHVCLIRSIVNSEHLHLHNQYTKDKSRYHPLIHNQSLTFIYQFALNNVIAHLHYTLFLSLFLYVQSRTTNFYQSNHVLVKTDTNRYILVSSHLEINSITSWHHIVS